MRNRPLKESEGNRKVEQTKNRLEKPFDERQNQGLAKGEMGGICNMPSDRKGLEYKRTRSYLIEKEENTREHIVALLVRPQCLGCECSPMDPTEPRHQRGICIQW